MLTLIIRAIGQLPVGRKLLLIYLLTSRRSSTS